MKTCPSCASSVPEDANTCPACDGPVDPPGMTTGDRPAAVDGGVATLAAPPRRVRAEVRPRRGGRRSGVRWVAIVAVLVVAGFAVWMWRGHPGLSGGRSDLISHRVTVTASDWTSYRAPRGAYRIDLPGTPERLTTEVVVGSGAKIPVDVAQVDQNGVLALVLQIRLPADASNVDLGSVIDGSHQDLGDLGFGNAQIIRSNPATTPSGPALDAAAHGTRNAEPSVALIRLQQIEGSVYQIQTVASQSQESKALDIQDRMVESFSVPASP